MVLVKQTLCVFNNAHNTDYSLSRYFCKLKKSRLSHFVSQSITRTAQLIMLSDGAPRNLLLRTYTFVAFSPSS